MIDAFARLLRAAGDRWRSADRGELVLVAALLVLSLLLHSWNMFGFPYYENDEATYISRAWQFVTTGELDVYTYRYDHAPAGWMVMGLWLGATGGPETFGSLLASGRILMLLVHLVSTALVYGIAKRVAHGSIPAGVIAAIVVAASPVGIYFQRRILLDNLLVLWVLVALWLLLARRLTLGIVILSGMVFGVAVLTKLNAAFLGLGFLVVLWARSRGSLRVHVLTQWLAFAGATVSLFFVYALLNQELLSAPIGADGEPVRVSLIDTFGVQLGRGDFAWPWDPQGSFLQAVGSWLNKDWLTLTAGAIATVALAVIAARRFRRTALPLAIVVLIVSYVAFLARGKVVIDLYVVPLIPLLAIAIGAVVGLALHDVPRRVARPALAASIATALIAGYATAAPVRHFYVDETSNQLAALDWIAENTRAGDVIVGDNYAYPALAQESDHEKVLYFFNAEYDPEARERYGDDWRNIDYLVVTHEVVEQISQGTVPKIGAALEHAQLQAEFVQDSSSYIDIPAHISTNGDWAQVYEMRSRNDIVLQDSWREFDDRFVVSYGRVVDVAGSAAATTSSDQALGLEQALLADDEAAFLGIWQWTADHLRHRADDALTSTRWESGPSGRESLTNADSHCGADLRFVGALDEAAGRWDSAAEFAATADRLLADWWAKCVFEWDGMLAIDSSADGAIDDQLVNPSYFDPALISRVAEKHPEHEWDRLLAGGYGLLDRLLVERGTVPDWVVLSRDRVLSSATGALAAGADALGEDSLRLIPALISAEVAGDARATAVLDGLVQPVLEYAEANPGRPADVTVAMLALVRDIGADPWELYRDAVAADYNEGAWGDSASLPDHVWAWSWHRLYALLPDDLRIPLA